MLEVLEREVRVGSCRITQEMVLRVVLPGITCLVKGWGCASHSFMQEVGWFGDLVIWLYGLFIGLDGGAEDCGIVHMLL